MTSFLGEHICKVDSKGRIRFPSSFKGQLAPENGGRFVLNRGFEGCLELYPQLEWQKKVAEVKQLNPYVRENREFQRFFLRGASPVELDNADRILLPRSLAQFADLGKEVLLTSRIDVIEIWNPKQYDALMKVDSDNYAALAERVMGDVHNPQNPAE